MEKMKFPRAGLLFLGYLYSCRPSPSHSFFLLLCIFLVVVDRIIVRPAAVEFLVHMALASGAASINSLAEDGLVDRDARTREEHMSDGATAMSRSEHVGKQGSNIGIRHQRVEKYSITGAQLDLQWRQLHNVEYLTDGGNSWIHTSVYNGKPVVVKTLKPECQDVALAINEIEGELAVHSRLNHPNIVGLIGAGTTSKGVRFVVLERLDGGTLTQMLGYDTRIRDRRRRFWRRKQFSFLDVLRVARSIADAMAYCHQDAIPNCIVLHRDLKPDNIGTLVSAVVTL
jgi:serine/threonine protein kinase